MFSVKFEGICKYLVILNLRVYGNSTVTQRIKKSWFISREDLNLLTINTQENTGLCHYAISVRKTAVVDQVLGGSPVRIIRIFAIHTGIFPASIADAVR